jgi:putative acetyltransferase
LEAKLRESPGFQLVQSGLGACRLLRHQIVVALGHPDRCPRFGFVPAPPLGVRSPVPAPEVVFMVLALVPSDFDGVARTARLAPRVCESQPRLFPVCPLGLP